MNTPRDKINYFGLPSSALRNSKLFWSSALEPMAEKNTIKKYLLKKRFFSNPLAPAVPIVRNVMKSGTGCIKRSSTLCSKVDNWPPYKKFRSVARVNQVLYIKSHDTSNHRFKIWEIEFWIFFVQTLYPPWSPRWKKYHQKIPSEKKKKCESVGTYGSYCKNRVIPWGP